MRPAADPPGKTYFDTIRDEVRRVRRALPAEPPASEEGWRARLDGVRRGLARSFGRVPATACDLAPEVLGTLRRDGYAIERLTFQSRPGVRVTANLYRPEPAAGPSPAVLSVHGHWPWGRIDPHVQAYCLGLARLGYVTLAVDAFGAGERAIEPGPGTYHGALVGASLWPTGVSLLGLQAYDNRRAIDYLLTRPEVDPRRLAITGASGGGNQSLYAGATDDRLTAVVPVCGVGTYESYIGIGCCVCEMNVGGLTYATTGDVLALIAPRALLVINATQDSLQFSVGEAAKSVAFARARYRALGAEPRLKHLAVESGHGYSQAMREAMYGWLDRSLREKGDGGPIAEPALTLEDPQTLRCYPDAGSRPRTVATIPALALAEGRARLADLPRAPDHPQRWEADAGRIRAELDERLGSPLRAEADAPTPPRGRAEGPELTAASDPGLVLRGRLLKPSGREPLARALLIRSEGEAEPADPIVAALLGAGREVATVDLRATGRGRPAAAGVRGVPDHNEAEAGLWVGRPLLGQWVRDALAWIDALSLPTAPAPGGGRPFEVVGVGPFGLVALIAAAFRPGRVARAGLVGPLVSLVGADEAPWNGLAMGLIAPGMLETADVGQVAGLIAPARLVVAGGVEPSGVPAAPARVAEGFAFARAVYRALGADGRLSLLDSADPSAFAHAFEVG